MSAPQAERGPPLRTLAWIARGAAAINRGAEWLAAAGLLGLMLLVVADIALRAIGRPIVGAVEMVGWLAAMAMAFALGQAQLRRSHVSMTLIADHAGARARALLDVVVAALSLLLFVFVTAHLLRYGLTLREVGSLSETLKVIVYPWVFAVAAGFAGLCLALLLDLLKSLGEAARQFDR
jgi:TRAP-type C4-dicarboxylate transport system permease small subunit